MNLLARAPSLGCVILFLLIYPARADNDTARQEKLNDGYFLLHQLSHDESQLPILLAIKHAPPEVKIYADRISQTAKNTLAALDRFEQDDRAIRMDHNPLPQIEQDVRDSISDDKQHQLLFGTSNAEFIRALLVSQIEASTYGNHLCKILADQETDPQRAKSLRRLSNEWSSRRDEAYRLLRHY